MITRLIYATKKKGPPSALLIIGNFGSWIQCLHLIPETGKVEHFGQTTSPSTKIFFHAGVKEQTREQIGTVSLRGGGYVNNVRFFDEVAARARKLWKDAIYGHDLSDEDSVRTRTGEEMADLVQRLLREAALDAIRAWEGREPGHDASVTDEEEGREGARPVFVVRIARTKEGEILPEPSACPNWIY